MATPLQGADARADGIPLLTGPRESYCFFRPFPFAGLFA